MNCHILVVENEIKLANFIKLELEYENYRVSLSPQGLTGLTLTRETYPDLILVDLLLPDMSGLDFTRQVRKNGHRMPIIVLLSQDSVEDRVSLLDAGGDDYLLKPFNSVQLLTIIKTYLKFNQSKEEHTLKFADLILHQQNREVFRLERKIDLTAKEFDLLEYLMLNCGEVLTREQILHEVWGYDFHGDSNIIEVYIRYLRLKLEANNEKRLIQTVRGVGYVLREK